MFGRATRSSHRAIVVGISALAATGCINPPPDPTTPTATTRYFADNASWNQTAAQLGKATNLQTYADRLFQYGGVNQTTAGDLRTRFTDYSVPIWDAREATTTVRVFQETAQQSNIDFRVPNGSQIPWNPTWKPAGGVDAAMAIVHPTTGFTYEFWRVNKGSCLGGGYNPFDPSHICIGGIWPTANIYRASDRDGTTQPVRGAGFNKVALVARAEEVKTGRIRHALQLSVSNIMFGGPTCDPISGTTAPGAGTTCGFYLPPATNIEWPSGPPPVCDNPPANTPTERGKTVPHGLRVALKITNAQIDAWLDRRGYTGELRSTARVFAVALREYGAIVSETACGNVGMQTDGLINGATKDTWNALGITDSTVGEKLLIGLITPGSLYAVKPPT